MDEILLTSFIGLATMSSAVVGTAIRLLVAFFCEALAGGAVLALIAHGMILEAIHEGGSLIVRPTVAGFLFALYLSLAAAFT
jgi:hypothetical protein